MQSVVTRGVNFGMTAAYTISASEQSAIETVASVDIPHSNICMNTPYFYVMQLVVRLDITLGRCWKSALTSIQRAGIESVGSNYPVYLFRK
jgi:hypothetical protein